MNRFNSIPYDEESCKIIFTLTHYYEELERLINGYFVGNGRAKSVILTKLEESHMWVGKAIRDVQIEREKERPINE